MTKEIIVSAPGKIILHGEHSVVYEKVALAASLNRRTTVQLQIGNDDNTEHLLKLYLPNVQIETEFNLDDIHSKLFNTIPLKSTEEYTLSTPNFIDFTQFLQQITNYLENTIDNYHLFTNSQRMALIALFYLFIGIMKHFPINCSLIIRVNTDLKISSGTGSSASYCTALSGVFLAYAQDRKENDEFAGDDFSIINKWATYGEQIMHGGASSGIDTAICTFGSFVKYRKGDPIEQIHLTNTLRIMLVDTRIPRDTKKMVTHLRELYTKYPNIIEPILNSMEAIALDALKCLQNDCNYDRLRELMNINHMLLCTLNVSHDTLDQICQIAKKFHFGSKLTGAGGGGYAIILLPTHVSDEIEQNLIDELKIFEYDVLSTSIGCVGVQIEQIKIF